MKNNILKSTFLTILVLLSALSSVISCTKITPSGIEATAVRSFDADYSRIEIVGPFAVESSLSSKPGEVRITADSNLLPQIEVFSVGETLVIRYKKHTSWSGHVERAEIKLPLKSNITSVNVSGSGLYKCNTDLSIADNLDIVASGGSEIKIKNIVSKDVRLNLSGASSFTGEIASSKLDVVLSGASVLNVAGRVLSCSAVISGASILNGRDLIDRYVFNIHEFSGNLSGASSAFFASDGSISGELSGASVILYNGHAITKNLTMTGGSSVRNQ